MEHVKSRKGTAVHARSVVPGHVRPTDCSLLGSTVHAISQTRTWDWVAISSSMGSSWPRARTCLLCLLNVADRLFHHCTTWEVEGNRVLANSLPHPGPAWYVFWGWIPDAKDLNYIKIPHRRQHNTSAYGASIMWPRDVCISELTTRKAREHFFSWKTLTWATCLQNS